jgi:hypothetical protein
MGRKRGTNEDRLISGRLRGKAARSGAVSTVLLVDGVPYVWSYRHGWLVHGKGIKVISISVALRPERTRELIVGLSLKARVEDGPPSDDRILAALEAGIRGAIEAGWDPESRGRAFRYEIAESD